MRWVAEVGAAADTPSLVLWFLGAGTGGAVILKLIEGALTLMRGRAERATTGHADAIAQRDHAWAELARRTAEASDAEHHYEEEVRTLRADANAAHLRARLIAEYASALRRLLIEAGVDEVPEWPAECTGWGR